MASNWYLYIGVFLVCTGFGTVVGILMLVFYFWDDLGKKLKFSQKTYNDNTFNINIQQMKGHQMAETATATKSPNYTDEMVETAISMYQDLGNEGLEAIAEAVGKNVRSVRSKLVREGIYVASEKPASRKISSSPSVSAA